MGDIIVASIDSGWHWLALLSCKEIGEVKHGQTSTLLYQHWRMAWLHWLYFWFRGLAWLIHNFTLQGKINGIDNNCIVIYCDFLKRGSYFKLNPDWSVSHAGCYSQCIQILAKNYRKMGILYLPPKFTFQGFQYNQITHQTFIPLKWL